MVDILAIQLNFSVFIMVLDIRIYSVQPSELIRSNTKYSNLDQTELYFPHSSLDRPRRLFGSDWVRSELQSLLLSLHSIINSVYTGSSSKFSSNRLVKLIHIFVSFLKVFGLHAGATISFGNRVKREQFTEHSQTISIMPFEIHSQYFIRLYQSSVLPNFWQRNFKPANDMHFIGQKIFCQNESLSHQQIHRECVCCFFIEKRETNTYTGLQLFVCVGIEGIGGLSLTFRHQSISSTKQQFT